MGSAQAYATTEHIHRTPAQSPALGRRVAGIKLICPILRRPGMTHADCVAHWLDRHVPLALEHHPGMTKYVTNVVDSRLSGDGCELDGIAELHFPSAEALRTGMFDSADGERLVREDMGRFIARTGAYRVAEYPQK